MGVSLKWLSENPQLFCHC